MKFLPLLALASTGFALPSPAGRLEARIINGKPAPSGSYPYLVSILTTVGESESRCGGTIISDTTVVTAAHCFVNATAGTVNTPDQVSVGFGDNNITLQQRVKASKLYIHPEYNPAANFANDIALLTFPKIKLDGNKVQSIPIYKGKLPPGTALNALGWGKTNTELTFNELPDVLMSTTVKTGDIDACKKFLPTFQSSDGLQICTENKLTPNTDTCQGDSGTGLIINVDGKPYIAGLVSYGYGFDAKGEMDATCALNNGFGVYTHVNSYLDFINAAAGKPKCRHR
ncbi:trypsin-like serine protease [Martensiomyces pterosporus]|nr:trypsin-like serine protease [Martensiomyces pterosporus]